jgi:D-beta-D-heptose 7-phosphate kinase/D-beta-D-heptose 1-phosphate adenosyltransferase
MAITAARIRALLKKIASRRILVIGDVMLDHYLWGDATRISPEAPVPVVDVQRDSYTAGGAGNVALNIAALGAKCTVAGYIGRDDAGRRLKKIFADKGIAHLPTPGRGATILKTRVLVQHQQLCRLDRESPPSSYSIDPNEIDRLFSAAIKGADAVILSDYAKGIFSDALISRVALLAHASGKFVALDPKPKRKLTFANLDLITPNKRESLQLAGIAPDPHAPFPRDQVCAELYRLYQTKHLVITLGEDGMLLSSSGRVQKIIPTAAREVFDVSGAGDTSLAGLVLALSAGADLETAAHFANAAAGVVVGKIGTATVTPAELIAYVGHTP